MYCTFIVPHFEILTCNTLSKSSTACGVRVLKDSVSVAHCVLSALGKHACYAGERRWRTRVLSCAGLRVCAPSRRPGHVTASCSLIPPIKSMIRVSDADWFSVYVLFDSLKPSSGGKIHICMAFLRKCTAPPRAENT